MKIEDIVRTTSPMAVEKRTILNIMFTQNVIGEKMGDVMKEHDLSPEQFNVLRILRGQKGCPANMSLIQERMIAKTSNTTRLVDKLVAKGLVTREICPANRRKMEVLITGKGLQLLEALDPKVNEGERLFTSALSAAELETLNLLLEKMRSNLCPDRGRSEV